MIYFLFRIFISIFAINIIYTFNHMEKKLFHKGRSRCRILSGNKEQLLDLLKNTQEDEFEFYLPDDWFTDKEISNCYHLVYNWKFDLEIDKFFKDCNENGFKIEIHTTTDNEDDEYKPYHIFTN